jgi:hypothetical protein
MVQVGGGARDEEPSPVAGPCGHCRPRGRLYECGVAVRRRRSGRIAVGGPATFCQRRVRRAVSSGSHAGARGRLRSEHRGQRDADVGALRRQQGDGRSPRLRLEREERGQADQPQLHPPRRNGRQDRPGHRVRRRPGPDGHGPHLRPAVRERRAARGHHGSDREHPGAEDGKPRPHDGRHVQRPPLRRSALRRRIGPLLQQDTLQGSRARSGEAADEPGRAAAVRRQDHGAWRRQEGLLPARQLRGLQHLYGRTADVGVGRDDRSRQVRRRAARGRRCQGRPPVRARHGQGRQRSRWRPRRGWQHVPSPVRHGQGRHDGNRQLQYHATR